ncbi:hypothetical protein R3W88_029569 [Solanum pinnatisectum]|uniref:Uncharacterized protein n=1 Tax=Solanum pinnatisectum TaxID=50273 RepID=A0AAV9K5Q3_9SOLN|nr:hypothetical protein R3W88_029569 [Solanum pinnatisectum]
MAIEIELSNQSVPINKISEHSVDWQYYGTKLQATLFNKHIDTWKDFLKTNKAYYIAKGLFDWVNPNYTSVHKEIELSITNNRIIKESAHVISTHNFADGFVSLEQAEKMPNGVIFDNS